MPRLRARSNISGMDSTTPGAIVVSWSAAVHGREAKLLEVFARALAYGERLRGEGRVTAVQIFATRVGPNRDTLMVQGCLDELMRIVVEDEFHGLMLEGTMVVQDLCVSVWEGGSSEWVATGLDPYIGKLQQHGLV